MQKPTVTLDVLEPVGLTTKRAPWICSEARIYSPRKGGPSECPFRRHFRPKIRQTLCRGIREKIAAAKHVAIDLLYKHFVCGGPRQSIYRDFDRSYLRVGPWVGPVGECSRLRPPVRTATWPPPPPPPPPLQQPTCPPRILEPDRNNREVL